MKRRVSSGMWEGRTAGFENGVGKGEGRGQTDVCCKAGFVGPEGWRRGEIAEECCECEEGCCDPGQDGE